MAVLPFDWLERAESAGQGDESIESAVVRKIADWVREACKSLPEPRFLGTCRCDECEVDSVLEWLREGGPKRYSAVFLSPQGPNHTDRSVFFTWLAAEWSYFHWPDSYSFWPELKNGIFADENQVYLEPGEHHFYGWLRTGFTELALVNHIVSGDVPWCFVESIRHQSGFPRTWWRVVFNVVMTTLHLEEDTGSWREILDAQRLPSSFAHAARRFPDDIIAVFEAIKQVLRTKQTDPLHRLEGAAGAAFAREPELLSRFVLDPTTRAEWYQLCREKRLERKRIAESQALRDFWARHVRVGLFVDDRSEDWDAKLIAAIDTIEIPRGVLPHSFGNSRIRLSATDEETGKSSAGIPFDYDTNRRAWVSTTNARLFLELPLDRRTTLRVTGRTPAGADCSTPVLTLFSGFSEKDVKWFTADPRELDFYPISPLDKEDLKNGDNLVYFPECTHPLLLLPRKEDVITEPEVIDRVELSEKIDLIVLPATPKIEILFEDRTSVLAEAIIPAPGSIAFAGKRLDDMELDETPVFVDWPSIEWTGDKQVTVLDLRLLPGTNHSNAALPRVRAGSPLFLQKGTPLELNDLAFVIERIDDTTTEPAPLPSVLLGRFEVRLKIACNGEQWDLRRRFTRLPPMQCNVGNPERSEIWCIPFKICVRGIETVVVTTKWSRTSGAHSAERTFESRRKGGAQTDLAFNSTVGICGEVFHLGVTLGFREDLPEDIAPSFNYSIKHYVDGLSGFLIETSKGTNSAHPFGTRSRVDTDRITECELVFFGGQPGEHFQLLAGRQCRDFAFDDTGRAWIALSHLANGCLETSNRKDVFCISFFRGRHKKPWPICYLTSDATIDGSALFNRFEPVEDPVSLPTRLRDTDDVDKIDNDSLSDIASSLWDYLLKQDLYDKGLPDYLRVDWRHYWNAFALLGLDHFSGSSLPRDILKLYEELRRAQTAVAIPWLYKDRQEPWKDGFELSQRRPYTDMLIRNLRGLGKRHYLSFLTPLLAASCQLDSSDVHPAGPSRLRYVLMRLSTGCFDYADYERDRHFCIPSEDSPWPKRSMASSKPVPLMMDYRVWWSVYPQDMACLISWELASLDLNESERRTFQGVEWPELPEIGEEPVDVISALGNMRVSREYREKGGQIREFIRIATATALAWSDYVVTNENKERLIPLLPAFKVVCSKAPVLARVLTTDTLISRAARERPGELHWTRPLNDSPRQIERLLDVRSYLRDY